METAAVGRARGGFGREARAKISAARMRKTALKMMADRYGGADLDSEGGSGGNDEGGGAIGRNLELRA